MPEAIDRARTERDRILEICRALSSEKDTGRLLDLILAKLREITAADAGSVYVLRKREEPSAASPEASGSELAGEQILHFMLSQNDSQDVDLKAYRLAVDDSTIVGQAVLRQRPINIGDLSRLHEPGENPSGLAHDTRIDDEIGYEARSMLTVPLISARDETLGVVQLINAKRDPAARLLEPDDFDAQVVPFDEHAEALALALAAQAGICLENATLYDELTNAFEGFVDASVTAIEARDPTTSGHSRRVSTLAVGLAERVDALRDGPYSFIRFDRDDLKQIEYAGMLHDFGKVGVREHVLVKAKKLHDWQRDAIQSRFRFIRKSVEAEALAAEVAALEGDRAAVRVRRNAIQAEVARSTALLDEAWDAIAEANEPTILEAPARARIAEIAQLTYADLDGRPRPYLEDDEVIALQVERGSLTSDERLEIQRHVDHTTTFLRTIPWGRALRDVPRIAGGHHELLDGSGYPDGLSGDEIAIETRMLTVADIFDALTASDRPYKAAVPVTRALDILASEVGRGRCDAGLFELFVGAKIYERVL